MGKKINKKTSICIVPARGNSKRLPNKNITDLNGFPLISYSLKAIKESNIFDRVVVSTDSEKIKKVAERYGVDVPYLRPKYLSTDKSLVEDSIFHMLKWIEKKDKKYDYVCVVQCSTPMIVADDFYNVVVLLNKRKAKMIVSVSKTPCNINWVRKLEKDLSMKNFFNVCKTNCQQFEETYILNGAIYMGEWDIFYNKKNYYTKNTFAYIMPRERSYDIDDIDDLKLVEFFLKKVKIFNEKN